MHTNSAAWRNDDPWLLPARTCTKVFPSQLQQNQNLHHDWPKLKLINSVCPKIYSTITEKGTSNIQWSSDIFSKDRPEIRGSNLSNMMQNPKQIHWAQKNRNVEQTKDPSSALGSNVKVIDDISSRKVICCDWLTKKLMLQLPWPSFVSTSDQTNPVCWFLGQAFNIRCGEWLRTNLTE